jgi:CHAT domain-containing protein
VPFAALRYSDRAADPEPHDEYVGATHAVAVRFRWRTAPTRATQSAGAAVVVGVPHGAAGWNPLPNAAVEAEEVRDRFRARSVPVVSPTDAAEILNEIPAARYFHIACHGTFAPDEPARSGLVLVSPSRNVELLTVRDIVGLDLRRMELCVLSGCWGADNFVHPGRWIVGLPAAFCHAGAKTIVASLWPVDDAVAARVFAAIYDGAQGSAEALLAVRKETIASVATADPFFWAGVQVYSGG